MSKPTDIPKCNIINHRIIKLEYYSFHIFQKNLVNTAQDTFQG